MKLIILDRDGVINHDSDAFIKTPDEWIPIDGSLEAIADLTREDYQVVIVTNQSGIARGLLSINTLNQIHQKLLDQLHSLGGEISAIFFCPHGADDDCMCRKPLPGMFHDLSKRLRVDLAGVYAVGDSVRDLQAATRAGATAIAVRTGKGMRTQMARSQGEIEDVPHDTPTFDDLSTFVKVLLSGDTATL
ncbi:MAG: D-glycero-beta-D-manno-heptose 1,7-bisphosphate 7-phosphatase [Pseudomonadota bacterium]